MLLFRVIEREKRFKVVYIRIRGEKNNIDITKKYVYSGLFSGILSCLLQVRLA